MKEVCIELKEITKYIGTRRILNDITLSIEKGSIYLLWGNNGAGKSMLIKVLCGAVGFDSGTLTINGKTYQKHAPALNKSRILAVSPQSNCITEELTVFQNLFIHHNIWFQNAETFFDKNIPEFLQEMGQIIRPFLYEKAKKLSPSLLNLLQIIRTVLTDREILIFDEPIIYFSDYEKDLFLSMISYLRQNGKTIIVISHMADQFVNTADYITILRDGAIVSTNSLRKNRNIWNIAEIMELTHIRSYPKLPINAGEELLKVEYLSGGIVKNVSFTLHKGEIIGITGTLSSGKTQIAKLLVGGIPKSYGRILYKGEGIHIKSPSEAIQQNIYYIPQDRDRNGLFLAQDIRFNIVDVNTLKFGMATEDKANALSRYYQRRLRINTKDISQKVSSLSNGNRQKVMVGRALCNGPEIYILDEPCAEVDKAGKTEIYNIINHLLLSGAGIIFISSDFAELSAMCDKILFMHCGQCIKTLEKEEIMTGKLYDLNMRLK